MLSFCQYKNHKSRELLHAGPLSSHWISPDCLSAGRHVYKIDLTELMISSLLICVICIVTWVRCMLLNSTQQVTKQGPVTPLPSPAWMPATGAKSPAKRPRLAPDCVALRVLVFSHPAEEAIRLPCSSEPLTPSETWSYLRPISSHCKRSLCSFAKGPEGSVQ